MTEKANSAPGLVLMRMGARWGMTIWGMTVCGKSVSNERIS